MSVSRDTTYNSAADLRLHTYQTNSGIVPNCQQEKLHTPSLPVVSYRPTSVLLRSSVSSFGLLPLCVQKSLFIEGSIVPCARGSTVLVVHFCWPPWTVWNRYKSTGIRLQYCKCYASLNIKCDCMLHWIHHIFLKCEGLLLQVYCCFFQELFAESKCAKVRVLLQILYKCIAAWFCTSHNCVQTSSNSVLDFSWIACIPYLTLQPIKAVRLSFAT